MRVQSHQRALKAIADGEFSDEMTAVDVVSRTPDLATGGVTSQTRTVNIDEGPRPETSLEGLAKLKPVFAAKGSVTAGNSSQTSDGAGALILASEKRHQDLRPDAAGAFRQLRRAWVCRRTSWASAPSRPSRPRCATPA